MFEKTIDGGLKACVYIGSCSNLAELPRSRARSYSALAGFCFVETSAAGRVTHACRVTRSKHRTGHGRRRRAVVWRHHRHGYGSGSKPQRRSCWRVGSARSSSRQPIEGTGKRSVLALTLGAYMRVSVSLSEQEGLCERQICPEEEALASGDAANAVAEIAQIVCSSISFYLEPWHDLLFEKVSFQPGVVYVASDSSCHLLMRCGLCTFTDLSICRCPSLKAIYRNLDMLARSVLSGRLRLPAAAAAGTTSATTSPPTRPEPCRRAF